MAIITYQRLSIRLYRSILYNKSSESSISLKKYRKVAVLIWQRVFSRSRPMSKYERCCAYDKNNVSRADNSPK